MSKHTTHPTLNSQGIINLCNAVMSQAIKDGCQASVKQWARLYSEVNEMQRKPIKQNLTLHA